MNSTEQQLKKLLSIEQADKTSVERGQLILQGVHWLTLLQAVLELFLYRIPLSLVILMQNFYHQSKDSTKEKR